MRSHIDLVLMQLYKMKAMKDGRFRLRSPSEAWSQLESKSESEFCYLESKVDLGFESEPESKCWAGSDKKYSTYCINILD